MFTLIKQGVPCPVLGSLLESRVVAMGTGEVGGETGLSALGETAELVRRPLDPRVLFRNCAEWSSRGFPTRART